MTYDVAIIGAGPAALAAAVACGERALRTVVVGGDDQAWPANYGGWADELREVGLGDFLGPIWTDAAVILDDADTQLLGRPYARVARLRLRAHLLERCERLGVEVRWAWADTLEHDATGSTLTTTQGLALRAAVVIDASGHRPRFVRRDGDATTWQAAVGILGTSDAHPWDLDVMTFMDLRTDHVDDALGDAAPTFLYTMPVAARRLFVEETSLVRGPAVPFPILRRRLRARLDRLGVVLRDPEVTEMCLIPMDTPVPHLGQRVVGFGGSASFVHPATGYQLARAFGSAPELAQTVADGLAAGRAPERVAREAWATIWTDEDLAVRELLAFGSRILAELDATEQRAFFRAFFSMPAAQWSGYLAGRPRRSDVVRAMAAMLYQSGPSIRWKLLRSGARAPRALLRAAV